MGRCRYDLSKDCHGRDCLVCTFDKIRAEIDRKTEIHSDGEFYIKNIDVKRIIDKYKYRAESEGKE